MQVVMAGAWREKCGVTEYALDLTRALEKITPVKRVALQDPSQKGALNGSLLSLHEADVVHLQYHPDHYGFWRYPRKVHAFASFLKSIRRPLVVTVHDLIRLPVEKVPGTGTGASQKGTWYRSSGTRYLFGILMQTPWGRFLQGGFLGRADHLVTHNEKTKEWLESLNVKPGKITVLYPGIPQWEVPKTDGAKKWGLEGRKILCLFGFIRPNKGYETALRAMKYLPQEAALVLAGGASQATDSPYLTKIRSLIESEGLSKRVVVTDYLEDSGVREVLSLSHVILLPHSSTPAFGFSYSLSYALAAKRPIVASNTLYFQEIHDQYRAFKMFEEDNPKALADAVLEILQQGPDKAQASGAERFRQECSWPKVAEKTFHLYERLLEKSGGRHLNHETNRKARALA